MNPQRPAFVLTLDFLVGCRLTLWISVAAFPLSVYPLLIRNLKLDGKNGLGAINKGDRVLQSVCLLLQLVANMTVLSGSFYERYGTDVLANRPNVYYGFDHYYDYEKATKYIGKEIQDGTKRHALPANLRTGGCLYVNASYGFRKGRGGTNLCLVNGFRIEIKPARTKPLA